MDYRIIREACRRDPFQPYVLRTTQGTAHYIGRPAQLAVTSRLVAFYTFEEENFQQLSPDDIESLQFVNEEKATDHTL